MRIAALKIALAGILGLCSPLPAAAQDANSPRLTANVDGVVGEQSSDLRIARLDVDVRVHGSLAMTELTATFANPGEQTLEGEFAIDLPRGSVMTGYALDVGEDMIDGVLQPRDRAREAFERRVVQRIDPGLGEVDFSDRFETRVYPIFPGQGRTIRIRFATPLDDAGRYTLRLDAGEVGEYWLRVHGAEPDSGGLEWSEYPEGFAARGSGQIDGEITFEQALDESQTPLLSEHPGEGRFFEISGMIAPRPVVRPTRLTVLWDRSVSRLDDEHAREAALAAAVAEQLRVDEVELVQFDSGAMETAQVPVSGLATTLGAVRYAGGTSYAGLADIIAARSGGLCLLFTDGRASIDTRTALTSGEGCRLATVSSGRERDMGWLEAQARAGGGAAIDLGTVDDARALALTDEYTNLVRIAAPDGSPIETRALPAPAGWFHLVGPMPDGANSLLVDGHEQAASPVRVSAFAAPRALWAQQHLATTRDAMSVEELSAAARRWSVAVPGISFIVLETPEDYAESGFVPPASYPKPLRAEYDRIGADLAEREAQLDKAHYEQLAALWAARKTWWATGQMAGATDNGDDAAEAAATAEEANVMNAPPPPPPPPPPPANAPARTEQVATYDVAETATSAAEAANAVVVTGTALSADAAAPAEEMTDAAATPQGTIEVAGGEWAADRPYIRQWIDADDRWIDAVRQTEAEHGAIPLFYLDLADWHFRAGRVEEARRAAEAALDLPTRDNQSLEIVAQRLLRYGAHDRAIALIELLVDREAERPHPRMQLAQALAQRGRAENRREDLVRAQHIMAQVAMKRWPGEYHQVGEIALAEANGLIAELGGANAEDVRLDRTFIAAMPVDIRVTTVWNTPRTDLDLWVVEPGGEEVGYNHRLSRRGGRYTHDVTGGFGPEEYQIRKAEDGSYQVEVNTFAADRRNPNGPSTVTVRMIRDFGTATPREEVIDVEMEPDAEGRKLIGRFGTGD